MSGGRVLSRLAVLASIAVAGCLPMTSRPSPFGATVSVSAAGGTARAELLAVSADSVWVSEGKGNDRRQTALPLSGISRVVVHRGAGSGGFVKRGLAFGVISGAGMYAACTSVTESSSGECVGIMVGAVAVSTILSFVAREAVSHGRDLTLTTVTPETLAPFARWPQGRPPGRQPASPPDPPSVP